MSFNPETLAILNNDRGYIISLIPSNDSFNKILDEDEINESDFLNHDEIAMVYNEKKDIIISPFYLSIENLMKSFKLKYIGKRKIAEKHYEVFYGDYNNIVALECREKNTIYYLTLLDETDRTRIELPAIHIKPTILVHFSGQHKPDELELKDIIENYNKNVFMRATSELLVLYKFLHMISDSTMNSNPKYIV